MQGFKEIAGGIITLILNSKTDKYTKEFLDASKSILITSPSLINFYIHQLFSSTNVFDTQLTIGLLSFFF